MNEKDAMRKVRQYDSFLEKQIKLLEENLGRVLINQPDYPAGSISSASQLATHQTESYRTAQQELYCLFPELMQKKERVNEQ